MFTGLVECSAKIVDIIKISDGARLVIKPKIPLKKVVLGESVAIDGCCLTVIKKGATLTFDVSDESIRQTKIKTYQKGTMVNLERAMRAGDRLGGHFVLGHVDGVGKITSIKRNDTSLEITLEAPAGVSEYLIPKGSVTIDGISLTVSGLKKNKFKVYIIPHTEKITNLGERKVGDLVNMEADMLGKYVRGLIAYR
ncbi:riboflavin synthase [bacterium]|nr:riboflavin synthase [bacterium]